jgi:hypothetical protein
VITAAWIAIHIGETGIEPARDEVRVGDDAP